MMFVPRSVVLTACALLCTCLQTAPAYSQASPADEAAAIIEASGVQGGFIVHVGSGDGRLTAALRVNDRYQVHGLDRSADNVAAAREHVLSSGGYGEVSIARLYGNDLPYIDNLVNLLVIEEDAGIDEDEILRVLAPNGVALSRSGDGWDKTVKPRPDNIDEWTHYLHDPSGNSVSHDDVVGPPKHLQWLGSPRWSRHHDRMASMSALVSANGRVFYIMDEGSRVSIQLPSHWSVIARDAFNGTMLWKKPLENWNSQLWPLKSGPTQLARRLVASADTVYVTLGFHTPIMALDAATGEVLREYEFTEGTEELIVSNGTLFSMINEGESELDPYRPAHNVGDQARVRTDEEWHWNRKPRDVAAYDAASGDELWRREFRIAPLSLSADDDHVIFHDGERVVCLDRNTGSEVWTSDPAGLRPNVTMNFGPRLVIYDGVVMYAGGDRKMTAFDAETGDKLWSSDHDQSGYQSPEDLLVIGGLVWCAPNTSGGDTGIYTARDIHTGEIKHQFAPDVSTYWFHHRCYITKATDKYLMPSRTGVEFVDFQNENWDINHWVRGGCLYGVMPCNGLTYTPPHDCACYPEAKLYGFNALAPAAPTRNLPDVIPEEGRLETGPAFGASIAGAESDSDWPTYRHDMARSGATNRPVPTDLQEEWATDLGGRLTSPVIADSRLYVAQIDEHTLHALSSGDGTALWSYTAGGRIDSPPTINNGRVLFGCTDGWVYCLRAADGELAWRYRAAPLDRRLMAFEQLESVWPVHGSVLVRDGIVYCVAGRSMFLDGGLRMLQLDAATGRKLDESVIDDRDPDTGGDIQDRLQVLQMPVGLPDILSSDGESIYMRSQRFTLDGERVDVGPISGDFPVQGGTQRGSGAHLFAPMGFLDDTWFHRAYWVYGKNFAGGHAGYYQAGRFAPSGRILASNGERVFGFARKPQYYQWTTIIEHQLFSSPIEAPEVPDSAFARRGTTTNVSIEKTDSQNPAGSAIAVEAWVKSDTNRGIVFARGGSAQGFALAVRNGKPQFIVRSDGELEFVAADREIGNDWTHLVGQMNDNGRLEIYVNGRLAGAKRGPGLLTGDPAESTEIGGDVGSTVGDYQAPLGFTGLIDEVRLYRRSLTDEEIARHHARQFPEEDEDLVAAYSFDEGNARDGSGHGNDGTVAGARPVDGPYGVAMAFVGRVGRSNDVYVEHDWNKDLPILVRSMVVAGETLFVAGPPDLIDEEATFVMLTQGDEAVQPLLAEQDAALTGAQGAKLLAVSTADGSIQGEVELADLPGWDAMASAEGRLFVVCDGGRIVCLGER